MTPSSSAGLLAAILCFALPVPAQSITGRVVSPTVTPLAGIVVDAGSGSTSATTNALGQFTILGLQPSQTYDLEFVPAFGMPWAATILSVTVIGATNVGDVVLQPGFPITGVARNEAGVGLPGANVNVYAQNGVKLFTPRDGTDLAGNFSVIVPARTWDVRVIPPVGTLLVPTQIEDLAVAGPVSLGNVVLPIAYLVTGSVVDSATSVPIAATRIKITNALTGARIYVPNDTTNLFGQFSLPLPWGIADLAIEPPIGNTHVGREVFGVLVGGPLAIGAIRLTNGVLLSGTTFGNGVPLASAEVDVLLADGTKIFTPRDVSAADGTFTVAIPTGVAITLRVEPPTGSGLVGVSMAPQTLFAATNVGTITLTPGIVVTGTVNGAGGPAADTRIRCFDTLTNIEVVTGPIATDAAGLFTTYVPPGTYRIEATTAEGSFYSSAQQVVTITATTTVNFPLATKLARTALTSFGTPTLPAGGLLPINVLLHSMVPGLQTILIDLAVRLPNGQEILLLPGLPLTLPQAPFQLDFIWVPVPPVPSIYLGRVIDMVIRLRNAGGTIVLDEARTPFVVE